MPTQAWLILSLFKKFLTATSMSNSPQKRKTALIQNAQVPLYLTTRTKVSLSMNMFSHFKNNIAHGKNFRKHFLSIRSSEKRDLQSEAGFLLKHNNS